MPQRIILAYPTLFLLAFVPGLYYDCTRVGLLTDYSCTTLRPPLYQQRALFWYKGGICPVRDWFQSGPAAEQKALSKAGLLAGRSVILAHINILNISLTFAYGNNK